jgi:hypothetical protein
MAKTKSRPVAPTKDRRAASLHVGVITVEQQRQMRKKQERDARIASGVRMTGAGVHDDDKRQSSRRERKQAKLDAKSSF